MPIFSFVLMAKAPVRAAVPPAEAPAAVVAGSLDEPELQAARPMSIASSIALFFIHPAPFRGPGVPRDPSSLMVELQFTNTFGDTAASFVKPEPRRRLTRRRQPQDNAPPPNPK